MFLNDGAFRNKIFYQFRSIFSMRMMMRTTRIYPTDRLEEQRDKKKSSAKKKRLLIVLIVLLVILGIFMLTVAVTGAGFLTYYLSKKSKA